MTVLKDGCGKSRTWAVALAGGLIFGLVGCGAPPQPYYAGRPVVVVAPPQEPVTQYVYGTVHSTNETHITSTSTVHIITNHPETVGQTPPATAPDIQPPDNQAQTPEPPPLEEEQLRAEPAAEPAAEPPQPEPSAPLSEPAPPPADASSSGSSGSGD